MTRRPAFLACAIAAASVLAACAPLSRAGAEDGAGDNNGDGKAATSDTGITFFGDARVGIAYGPDRHGKSRTRIVAE